MGEPSLELQLSFVLVITFLCLAIVVPLCICLTEFVDAFWPGGRDETALPLPRQEMMSPTRPAATPESASDWEVLDFSPSSSGSDRESPQLLWSPMGIRSRPLPKRAKFNHFGLVRMQRVEPERQYIAIQTR